MRKIIVTNPAPPIESLRGWIGVLDDNSTMATSLAGALYKVKFDNSGNKESNYLYRGEFEYLQDYLLKYWLET